MVETINQFVDFITETAELTRKFLAQGQNQTKYLNTWFNLIKSKAQENIDQGNYTTLNQLQLKPTENISDLYKILSASATLNNRESLDKQGDISYIGYGDINQMR